MSLFGNLSVRARTLPGVFWMILNALLCSLAGMLVVRIVTREGGSIFWVGWMRFAFGLLSMTIPALFGAWSLRITNRRAFILRGACGCVGQFFFFAAVAYVGLGRGTVLSYLLCVVGAVAGIPILGERPSLKGILAVVIGFCGVALGCNAGIPHGAEWLALGCALFSGVTLAYIRLLRRTDSNMVAFYSQSIFGTLFLLPFLFFHPMPGGWTLALILMMCVLDSGAQLCINQGLSMLPVAKGGALIMLTPVFSLVMGVLLFSEQLSARQWIGCSVVIGAAMLATVARTLTTARHAVIVPDAAPTVIQKGTLS